MINDEPIEMALCEINQLILHPDQVYIFRKFNGCKSCEAYLKGTELKAVVTINQHAYRVPLEVKEYLERLIKLRADLIKETG